MKHLLSVSLLLAVTVVIFMGTMQLTASAAIPYCHTECPVNECADPLKECTCFYTLEEVTCADYYCGDCN